MALSVSDKIALTTCQLKLVSAKASAHCRRLWLASIIQALGISHCCHACISPNPRPAPTWISVLGGESLRSTFSALRIGVPFAAAWPTRYDLFTDFCFALLLV